MNPRALAVAALLAGALPARAVVWTPLGPAPPAGAESPYVHALAISSTYLFAGADAGVYRSADRGASWELVGPVPADPNAATSILALAVDPRDTSTVYAGSYLGLWKSVDSGTSWSLIFAEGSVYSVALDPVSPSVIYAGGGPKDLGLARLFRSADSGATWNLLASTSDYYPFTAIAVSPTNPQTILAGTQYGYLYRSTNGGLGWSIVPGPFDGWIRTIVFDPAEPETVYASHMSTAAPTGGFSGGVARSRDAGATWTALPLPPKWAGTVALDPASGGHLVTSSGVVVYETTDGGDNWSAISDTSTSLSADAIVFDPQRAGTIYLAAGGVYRADLSASPCGVTALCPQNGRFEVTVDWQGTPLGPSLPAHPVSVTGDSGYFWFFGPENVEVMVKVLDGRPVNGAYWVFCGALTNLAYRVTVRDTLTSAVWTHDNAWGEMASVADTNAFPAPGGASMSRRAALLDDTGSWTAIGPGPPNAFPAYSVAADPRFPRVIFVSHEDLVGNDLVSVLSRTLDGGATWRSVLQSQYGGHVFIDPAAPGDVYYVAEGIWRSSDGGSTWTGPFGPEAYGFGIGADAIYAGTWAAIAVSRDAGESWETLPIPGSDDENATVTAIGVDRADPARIYAGTAGGFLWRSVDGGSSWTLARSHRDYGLTSIFVGSSDHLTVHVGTTYMGPTPMGLFQDGEYLRSADGGQTWTEFRLPADGQAGGFDSLIPDPTQPRTLYAGSGGGVYRSIDGGARWARLGPNERVTDLSLSGSTLYAATFDGAFSRDVSALPRPCSDDPNILCLADSRFRVRAFWKATPDGPTVQAQPIPLTRDTGSFWFFEPANVELVVKVLDGRPVNGKFWVFVGGLSSVPYSIEVTDTQSGTVWTHEHASGELESFADTSAF